MQLDKETDDTAKNKDLNEVETTRITLSNADRIYLTTFVRTKCTS